MSNCEVFQLPPITVEPYQVPDCLRSVFHTILFNRALGTVSPLEAESDLFDLTWVQCSDEKVHENVERNIREVVQKIGRHEFESTRNFLITLSFYETRKQQSWFGTQEKHLYWEQWRMPLAVLNRSEQQAERQRETGKKTETEAQKRGEDNGKLAQKRLLESDLRKVLLYIVDCVNKKRDHIPPVIAEQSLTYPFGITVEPAAAIAEGATSRTKFGLELVRRALSSTQPPSVLH